MTIDEGIKKLLEQAEQQDKWANNYRHDNYDDGESVSPQERRQHATECRQIVEWLKELKEAQRLLKAAVEDMHIEDMCDVCVERIPNSPIHCTDGSNCFVRRYKDEALKLIGEDVNEI